MANASKQQSHLQRCELQPTDSDGTLVLLQKSFKKSEYLWELISPKEKDGMPARSPTGRYRVKLFLLVSNCFRHVQQGLSMQRTGVANIHW